MPNGTLPYYEECSGFHLFQNTFGMCKQLIHRREKPPMVCKFCIIFLSNDIRMICDYRRHLMPAMRYIKSPNGKGNERQQIKVRNNLFSANGAAIENGVDAPSISRLTWKTLFLQTPLVRSQLLA